jgi:cystathionine beta-synthase
VEGIGNDKLPSTLDFELIDEYHTVSDRDAFHMARRLTREEGLFVGGSAGLIVWLGVRVAREVTIRTRASSASCPDTGERYLSKMYNEEWMRENRLLEPERLTAGEMVARKDGGAPASRERRAHTPVREALRLITDYNISQLPVCDGDECVGSVPESLLMARIIEDPARSTSRWRASWRRRSPSIDGSCP